MDADTLMRRLHELEEENKRLKSLLSEHGIPFEACAHDGNLASFQSLNLTSSTTSLSLQEKVELFTKLNWEQCQKWRGLRHKTLATPHELPIL